MDISDSYADDRPRSPRYRTPSRSPRYRHGTRSRSPPAKPRGDRKDMPIRSIEPDSTAGNGKSQITEDNMDMVAEDNDDTDAVDTQLEAMMGFGGFGTTKQKKVAGNDVYAVRKEKKTEYRQYMLVSHSLCMMIGLHGLLLNLFVLGIVLEASIGRSVLPSQRTGRERRFVADNSEASPNFFRVRASCWSTISGGSRRWRWKNASSLNTNIPVLDHGQQTICQAIDKLYARLTYNDLGPEHSRNNKPTILGNMEKELPTVL